MREMFIKIKNYFRFIALVYILGKKGVKVNKLCVHVISNIAGTQWKIDEGL